MLRVLRRPVIVWHPLKLWKSKQITSQSSFIYTRLCCHQQGRYFRYLRVRH
jgi:hypothetical protein